MRSIHLVCRGGAGFGSGHLHRVSWLAQALRESRSPPPELKVHCVDSAVARAFWQALGLPVSWLASASLDHLELDLDSLVCVDWLDSSPAEAGRLAGRCKALVLLDDYGPAQAVARLVINALLSPLAGAETQRGAARVLSGAQWLQLPPEATKLRNVAIPTSAALGTELTAPTAFAAQPVRMLLVNFGGEGQAKPVGLALDALAQAGFDGKVVVIPAPQTRDDCGLDVDWHPAGPEFHSLLAAADMAICAGGLALYEAAYLGIPAICLPLVEHQLASAVKLEAAGCCLNTGLLDALQAGTLARVASKLIAAPYMRARMTAAGLKLLDGKGLARTADAILGLADAA